MLGRRGECELECGFPQDKGEQKDDPQRKDGHQIEGRARCWRDALFEPCRPINNSKVGDAAELDVFLEVKTFPDPKKLDEPISFGPIPWDTARELLPKLKKDSEVTVVLSFSCKPCHVTWHVDGLLIDRCALPRI